MIRIAQAVHGAHRKAKKNHAVVHRDLRPENILLDNDGTPYVADFGLAATVADLHEGKAGVGGTVSYMSPEQVRECLGRGRGVNTRSDIWSLGVILYETVTGKLPFLGASTEAVMEAIERDVPPPPRDRNANVPDRLDAIIRKCLRPDQEERYQTAQHLAEDLLASLHPPTAVSPANVPNAANFLPETNRGDKGIPPDILAEIEKGDALEAECKYADAAAIYDRAVQLAQAVGSTPALIRARIELGETLTRQESNLEKAKEVLDACLADLKTNPDPKARSTVLHLLAHIDICQGRVQEGKALAREALENARSRADRAQEGNFLISLAHAEEMAGNLAEAHRLLDEAATLFRIEYREANGKDKRRAGINLAGTFAMKAAVYEHEGKAEEMLTCLTESENLVREADHPDNLGRVLVSKCKALFAKSKWDDGIQALDEAREIFHRIDSVHWLLKCIDMRARLAFQMDDRRLALGLCLAAIDVASQKGTPEDHVHVLGQTAELCRRYDLDEQAENFHAEAKRIATENDLVDLKVDLLLDEANARRGKDKRREDDEEGKAIVREVLTHLEALLVKCQVKGRRAHYMRRIGSLHGRLGNLTEARSWFEKALQNAEEIGDAHGMADSLVALAATATEDGDDVAATGFLESLLERSRGKPFHHFQAGAHHDLARLKMSQGDLNGARKHLETSQSICATHPMRDIEQLLTATEMQIQFAERCREAPPNDLLRMLRELHAWKDRHPEVADAILPCWYHWYSADLWSNCRCMFGIKFFVRASRVPVFEQFAAAWSDIGDWFIYAASFVLKAERGIDVFPSHPDMLKPPGTRVCGFEKKSPSPEQTYRAFLRVLRDVPYFLTMFSDVQDHFPSAGPGRQLCVVGRRYRLPVEIREMMLGTTAEDLIRRKVIALPVHEEQAHHSLQDDLRVAWENNMIPIFFGSLPSDKGVSQAREVTIHVRGRQDREMTATTKRCLRRFMSEVGTSPDVALERLVDELEQSVERDSSQSGETVRLKLLKFKAGPNDVTHPVLILPEPLPSNRTVRERPLGDAAVQQRHGMQLPRLSSASRQQSSDVPRQRPSRIGRNDPCPCGSGKKFKKCCGKPGSDDTRVGP
jgi:tetratricopeptide (TPR) repeat protein